MSKGKHRTKFHGVTKLPTTLKRHDSTQDIDTDKKIVDNFINTLNELSINPGLSSTINAAYLSIIGCYTLNAQNIAITDENLVNTENSDSYSDSYSNNSDSDNSYSDSYSNNSYSDSDSSDSYSAEEPELIGGFRCIPDHSDMTYLCI